MNVIIRRAETYPSSFGPLFRSPRDLLLCHRGEREAPRPFTTQRELRGQKPNPLSSVSLCLRGNSLAASFY